MMIDDTSVWAEGFDFDKSAHFCDNIAKFSDPTSSPTVY